MEGIKGLRKKKVTVGKWESGNVRMWECCLEAGRLGRGGIFEAA
jgi:hypothetical protein